MNDQQNNAFITGQTTSYVDAYTPPDGDAQSQFSQSTQAPQADPSFDPSFAFSNDSSEPENNPQPAGDFAPVDFAPVDFSPPHDPASDVVSSSSDASGDTAQSVPPSSTPPGDTSSDQLESLEEQNIFVMLGVENGTESQKESFLDELQQVIWEDFLEHDVELLISSEEFAQLQTMVKDRPTVDLEQQEKIVVFLEKIIPDLEEIMLEKALQLKGDMFRERIAGMREFYAANSAILASIDQAEEMMNQNKWGAASQTLNSLQEK